MSDEAERRVHELEQQLASTTLRLERAEGALEAIRGKLVDYVSGALAERVLTEIAVAVNLAQGRHA